MTTNYDPMKPVTIRQHAENRAKRMFIGVLMGRDPKTLHAEETLIHFILDATGRGGISEAELLDKVLARATAQALKKDPNFVLTEAKREIATTNVHNFLEVFSSGPTEDDDAPAMVLKDDQGRYTWALGRDPSDPDLNRSVSPDEYQPMPPATTQERVSHTHLI